MEKGKEKAVNPVAVAMYFSAVIAAAAWAAAAGRAVEAGDFVAEAAPIVLESGGSRGGGRKT